MAFFVTALSTSATIPARVSSARRVPNPSNAGAFVNRRYRCGKTAATQGEIEYVDCGPEDYLVLGLARCFEKQGNKLIERDVIEPVTAGTVESMAAGAKTSYLSLTALNLGQAVEMDTSSLPASFAGHSFGEDFLFRSQCATRTWGRPHAVEMLQTIVPKTPESRDDWNFNVESHQRILNFENVVSDADNVKQDISIDVYGRDKNEGVDVSKDLAQMNKDIEDSYNA